MAKEVNSTYAANINVYQTNGPMINPRSKIRERIESKGGEKKWTTSGATGVGDPMKLAKEERRGWRYYRRFARREGKEAVPGNNISRSAIFLPGRGFHSGLIDDS